VRPTAPSRENLNFDRENISDIFTTGKTPSVNFDYEENKPKFKEHISFGEMTSADQLLNQTSIMAKLITKSNEKDDVGKVKIKGVEFEDLHKFLSSYSCDSDLSAVYQLPKELRKAMEKILKVPMGISLINHYKDSIGPNQRFIRDLTDYITSFRDFSIVSIIRSHDISSASEFDSSKIYTMLACCEQELFIFRAKVNAINSLEIKKSILNNIGPKIFRDYVINDYGDKILSDYCSIKEMINLVEQGLSNYSVYRREHKKFNTPQGKTTINATKVNSEEKKTEEKTQAVKSESKAGVRPLSCWNCSKDHRVNDCPEVCRIHKKNCKNIFRCLKIDKTESDLAALKSSEEISLCINPNGCSCTNIIDTGASATATFSRELFNKDSIELDLKSDGVEVGNGNTIDIAGKGTIGNKKVHYVPELKKTVVASDVFQSENRVTIMIKDKLVILKNDCDIIDKLIEIERISEEKDLIVVEVQRENGIYPMTDEQVKRVCSDDNPNRNENSPDLLLDNNNDSSD
jgi:hypothetical protein